MQRTQLLLNTPYRTIPNNSTKTLQIIPKQVFSAIQLVPSRFQHLSRSQIPVELKSKRENIEITKKLINYNKDNITLFNKESVYIRCRIDLAEKALKNDQAHLSYLEEYVMDLERELAKRGMEKENERSPLDFKGFSESNLQDEFDKTVHLIERVKNLHENISAKPGERQSCEIRIKNLEEKVCDLKNEAKKRGIELTQKTEAERNARFNKPNRIGFLFFTVLAMSVIVATMIVRQVCLTSKSLISGFIEYFRESEQTIRKLEKILEREKKQTNSIPAEVRLEMIKKELNKTIVSYRKGG